MKKEKPSYCPKHKDDDYVVYINNGKSERTRFCVLCLEEMQQNYLNEQGFRRGDEKIQS